MGSYWNASEGNVTDEYDFVLNRDGGGRGTVHVQGDELVHCGMFIRNYTVDIHLENSGIGCAWYELNSTTGSLLSDMQAPNENSCVFCKRFLPHSHVAWNVNNTDASHRRNPM